MNKILLWAGLLLLSPTVLAHHDIWHKLFTDKLAEAGQGDSDAQYDIGSMYQSGRGTKASREQALEWYRKSAAQHNAKAVSRLKLMESNTARFDRTLALAQKGDRASLYEVGHMYNQGIGTEIDIDRAIASYEQAARMGHMKAAWKLGLLYYEGTGVSKNYTLALKWFRPAAESGLPAAQYQLGTMYADGQGIPADRARALEWLRKAVDGGFDQARGELINVRELMAQDAAAESELKRKPQPEPVRVAAAPAPEPARHEPEKKKAAGKPQPPAKHYRLGDLMADGWTDNRVPVDYLPSAISNCRTEDDKLVCYSYELTRQTAAHDIRYKTKSIIDDFSDTGHFTVTYRHLVIDAKPLTGETEAATYTVKTGWGSAHTLDCEFRDDRNISCLKNGAHSVSLTSTTALAGNQ